MYEREGVGGKRMRKEERGREGERERGREGGKEGKREGVGSRRERE